MIFNLYFFNFYKKNCNTVNKTEINYFLIIFFKAEILINLIYISSF